MESIKTDSEVWYKTFGGHADDGYFQTYELSPPTEVRTSDDNARSVIIHAITKTKDSKEFKICLDSINNPVFIISNDELSWAKIDIHNNISKKFADGYISKLRSMLINADKTLEDYLKEHPKFDMDEDHSITITEVIFKEPERIEIKFVANNRIFNRNNKLYVGFDVTDEDGREWNYVFKITEKHIPIRYGYSFGTSSHSSLATPFQEYVYIAEFHGYYRPTEEDILNATFRWIVSDEVIKTSNNESRILKEEDIMLFLENVHTEFTVQDVSVEGGEDRHFTLDLNAMIGDHIKGAAFLDIPTKYPYSLSIEERRETSIYTNFGKYTCIPVVSGIAYISLDEIKELKKDPYKFCIENGIIEGNEQTGSENESNEENEEENKNDS